MATVYELANATLDDSREGSPSASVPYLITGATDDADAYAALADEAADTRLGLWLLKLRVDHQGGGVYRGTADYGVTRTPESSAAGNPVDPAQQAPAAPGENSVLGPEWSFSTLGGTERIRQAKERKIGRAVAGRAAPASLAIGEVGEDGPEGVEVPATKFEKKTTRKVTMTPRYEKRLGEMTATINDRAWMGYLPGEVLFLGAEGQMGEKDGGRHTVTYHFAVSPSKLGSNANPIEVAPGLMLLETKRGWDYLWVGYEPTAVAGNAGVKRNRAIYFCVDRVFDERDFRLLGLGG